MEQNGFVFSCFLFVLLLVIPECTSVNMRDNHEGINSLLKDVFAKEYYDTTNDIGVNLQRLLSTLIHEAVYVNTTNEVCDQQFKEIFNHTKTWALQSKKYFFLIVYSL